MRFHKGDLVSMSRLDMDGTVRHAIGVVICVYLPQATPSSPVTLYDVRFADGDTQTLKGEYLTLRSPLIRRVPELTK